jgi:hypothetical protein
MAGAGIPFESWVRATFTDWDKLTAGDIICEACLFCFEDSNLFLDARIGRPRQRMRNYSHFVSSGEWFPVSKGAKPQMLDMLHRHPEVAVIAQSGQKHIIFRALPGWWQFEETRIRPDITLLDRALALILPLYAGGFSKGEIASGFYGQRRILEFGVAEWMRCDQGIKSLRGSPIFAVAIFLAQRDKEENDGDQKADTGGDCGQSSLALVARGE